MKDIVIIANFCDGINENTNNRFNYLASIISKYGNDVELITSNFSHRDKCKRNKNENKDSYRITMLNEPSYYKNISIRRFYAHFIFSRNVKLYLEKRKKPDLIYCAIPSLDVGKSVAKYCKKNRVKLIIDIQDIWPEAFKMIFNIPILSDILFFPMRKQADFIYKTADDIIAVSKTYLNRAIQVNENKLKGKVVFLGTDLNMFDKIAVDNSFINKVEEEILLVYLGTLGHSYNLSIVFEALEIAKNNGVTNIKFIILGDGPLMNKYKEDALKKQIQVEFKGRLAYSEMVKLLVKCDIAINPISKDAAQSIINKHADYAAAGLPVLNTQESKEYRELVEKYNMGINCENDNAKDLAKKLMTLCKDKELRKIQGNNSRKLAEDMFNRSKTYIDIVELIEKYTND